MAKQAEYDRYEDAYKTARLFIDQVNALDERTKTFLMDFVYNRLETTMLQLDCCGTPIEKLMAISLEKIYEDIKTIADDYCSLIDPQREIYLGKKTYIVDFLISFAYKGKTINIVIECDGHEFHEKTKEQARKDKARERDLVINGYVVLRFTGSEIWKDPYQCSDQVMRYIIENVIS